MMDYKDTLQLPSTNFKMKANLRELEPEILKNWENIYSDIYKSKEGKEKFILHSGPPYANGDIHMGHALNGILKDIICKSENMKGRQAALVFGWDCHGLPIEWKIEEQVIKNKESIEKIGEKEFRNRCKDFALHWVLKQKSSFKRLGIFFDEKNPYITMGKSSQAAILNGLRNVILNDLLYCAKRPVFWSVIEKTALAEAEVEYKTIKSKAIYVGFKVKKSTNKNLSDAKIIIWTTTPWTIPGNRAICFNEKIEYILIDMDGEKFIIARERLEEFKKDINNPNCKILIEKISTDDIKSITCNHPMDGYDFDVPMLGGDHVTTEMGTGFVHTAPCYGEDDFKICKKNGIAPDDVINDNGVYKDDINIVSGMHIFKAGKVIIEHLKEKNNLVFEYDFEHSYPHSWRSKAPLIYRATSQFFIDLSKTDIREKAIKEIKKTKWHPKKSINRIISMVKERPDWCISRQRKWGVPIAIFIHKDTNKPLSDIKVFDNVVKSIEREGVEVWFEKAESFLPQKYKKDYIPVYDVIDVWFDSGRTYSYVLSKRDDLKYPADLYLEGSDQHRGWFQSSLLSSIIENDKAPYKEVLTHGFMTDSTGAKLSKSLGNVISVEDILNKYGIDVFRLWIVSADYFGDLKISDQIMQSSVDVYRKIRNTLRYLLSALKDHKIQNVQYDDLDFFDKLILAKIYKINKEVKESKDFDFKTIYTKIHNFCNDDLSAFYFDIKKDSLYCDDVNSIRYKSNIFTLNHIFENLIRWIAPVLSFTAEEAFLNRHKNEQSVHLKEFLSIDKEFDNDKVLNDAKFIMELRSQSNIKIEKARNEKQIGSSLECDLKIIIDKRTLAIIKKYNIDINEMMIVSNHEINVANDSNSDIVIKKAKGEKCKRCWKIKKVLANGVCERCDIVCKKIAC